MSFILPLLDKDPIARLGADPKRVTQMAEDTSFEGSFVETGGKTLLSMPFIGPHISRTRPDLAGGDVVALRARGQPTTDKGQTLIHEFAHRGFSILRKRGALEGLERDGWFRTSRGTFLNEEEIIRLMDYRLRGNKDIVVKWFAGRKITEGRVIELARDSAVGALIDKLGQLAQGAR
jgi:hypothetical protein